MKATILCLILATGACFAEAPAAKSGHGIEFLPQNRQAPIGMAAGDDALKQRREAEKFGGFATKESARKGWDLESNSEFIIFDGKVTILPKGAILHVPERNRQDISSKLTGTLELWGEFSAKHRGLVTTFEVTSEEASGQASIRPARLEAMRKGGLIVVATLNGNPISVSKASQDPAVIAR